MLVYLLASSIPFVVVFLLKRGCSAGVIINLFLDMLGCIPRVVYAWYIIGQSERRKLKSCRKLETGNVVDMKCCLNEEQLETGGYC